MTTTRQTLENAIADLGITMTAQFIPWSQSRNKGEKVPSLNWRVSLSFKGKEFIATDYMQGCAHCPSYGNKTNNFVAWECEHGKIAKLLVSLDHIKSKGPIPPPSLADVLYCLLSDSSAIDCRSFEEWADELGYDHDSRKAEATYRACLDIGLRMRNTLGQETMDKLRELLADY